MISRGASIIIVLAITIALAACDSDDAASPEPGTPTGPPAGTVSSPVDLASVEAAKMAVQQARWWAWAAAEVDGRDPVSDLTGEDCARNQPPSAWFLAGTFGGKAERRCAVPLGRPLIAPAVNLFSERGSDCAIFMRSASGEVLVDGAPVTLDRITSEMIEFTGVAGNATGTEADPVRAVACGLWARIPRLSPGPHRVTIQGRSDAVSVDVVYTLDVSAA